MISVIMPNLNNQEHISKSIESILVQSFTDFEFIIIDNNSTDNSPKIIQDLSNKDRRIVRLSSEKRGISHLLNLGLNHAKYEYVARMDSDDISLPNRLEVQLDYMTSHPDVAVLGSPTVIIDEKDKIQFISNHPADKVLYERIRKENAISHPTVLFRKSKILAAGGYNPLAIHAEDYDLWLRVMKIGRLQNLATPLLKYRVHNNASGFQKLLNQRISAFVSQQIHLFNMSLSDETIHEKEYSLDYVKNFTSQPVGLEKFAAELKLLLGKYYNEPREDSEKLVTKVKQFLQTIT